MLAYDNFEEERKVSAVLIFGDKISILRDQKVTHDKKF